MVEGTLVDPRIRRPGDAWMPKGLVVRGLTQEILDSGKEAEDLSPEKAGS